MLKKYQLRNKMNVILYPLHKSPVISTQIWVNNGSADEYPGVEGVSHFIEHLVFKGSKKYGVGEIAKGVEAAGGQLNAYTSFDQTVFYITLSKHFSETALDMLSQMMGYPIFDANEIDNEREVVIEEIKRSSDSLARIASQSMFANVFQKHPYGIPIIGYKEVIRKITKKQIVDYYHSQYSPANMTLLVVGDFKEKSMRKSIKKYFDDIPYYKTKKIKRKKEPEAKKLRLEVVPSKFQEARLNLSWKAVAATDEDAYALDLLAAVLGQFESSYLIQRLRVQNPCVNFIYSSSFTPKDPGLFAISAGFENKNLELVLENILHALEECVLESFGPDLLQRAVVNMESEEIYAQQTVDGLSGQLGQNIFYFSDPLYFKKKIKKLKKITTKDLLRVFKKYLRPDYMNITYVYPENEKVGVDLRSFGQDYRAFYKDLEKAHVFDELPVYKKPKRIEAKKHESNGVELIQLKSGARVHLVENHDVPIFHLQVAGHGGLRTENEKNNGVANLLSYVWNCGTDSLSEQELASQLESLSTNIQSFSGRNSLGLKMTSLSKNQNASINLFTDILLKNNFKNEIVEREKQQILTAIRNKKDYPAQIAIHNLMQKMFPLHPYSLELEGNEKSLSTLDHKDIEKYKQQHIVKNNLEIVAVGSFDREQLLKDLEKAVSNLEEGNNKKQNFSITLPEKEVFTVEEMHKEQNHIFVAYPGLTYTDKDKYKLMLLEAILAGQGGRLFLELRDKESLAYSVSPMHMEGIDAGYFAVYIACSPEKSEKAIRMIKTEIHRLAEELVSEEDLARAKRYLIGKHDISLQKNSSIASAIMFDVLYGADKQDYLEFASYIEKINRADIQDIARKLFAKSSVISGVGRFKEFSITT
tara:strand:+ start:45633 stop:48245 length:2613 start_codon:yes stop_codon:yes gene_type:complete